MKTSRPAREGIRLNWFYRARREVDNLGCLMLAVHENGLRSFFDQQPDMADVY